MVRVNKHNNNNKIYIAAFCREDTEVSGIGQWRDNSQINCRGPLDIFASTH